MQDDLYTDTNTGADKTREERIIITPNSTTVTQMMILDLQQQYTFNDGKKYNPITGEDE